MDGEILLQGAVVAWLIVCAWWDCKKREVPNGLTLPPIGAAVLLRLLGLGSGATTEEVIAIFMLLAVAWFAHVAGGADIKVSLALTILNPALAGWAWIGAMVCYFALRLVGHKMEKFPGMVGFLCGTLVYGLWRYLV